MIPPSTMANSGSYLQGNELVTTYGRDDFSFNQRHSKENIQVKETFDKFNPLGRQADIKELLSPIHQQESAVQTPSPYPSVDCFTDLSACWSGQNSLSASPLVVLPLPTNTTSTEPKTSTSNCISSTQLEKLYRTRIRAKQAPQRFTNRTNELAEYAKQYEDLYTRRMGSTGCNSSTSNSGSVPSAPSLPTEHHKNKYNKNPTGYYRDNRPLKQSPDCANALNSAINTPLPLEKVFLGSDTNPIIYTENQQHNILQWVKNNIYNFPVDFSSANENMDQMENCNIYNVGGGQNITCGSGEDNNLLMANTMNKLEKVKENQTTRSYQPTNPHNFNGFGNNKTVTEDEEYPDPNKFNHPDLKSGTGKGVKGLVSAFNQQIESQKVNIKKIQKHFGRLYSILKLWRLFNLLLENYLNFLCFNLKGFAYTKTIILHTSEEI